MPDTTTPPIGINCKTFRNTGNQSAPVWNVLGDISDESLQVTYDEATFDRRGAPTRESEPTIRACELTLKLLKDPTDPQWQAMNSAFLSRSAVDVMALSAGAQVFGNGRLDLGNTPDAVCGVRFNGKMFGFTEGRNLNDATFNETTIKPCFKSEFTIATVETGALTYTPPASA